MDAICISKSKHDHSHVYFSSIIYNDKTTFAHLMKYTEFEL